MSKSHKKLVLDWFFRELRHHKLLASVVFATAVLSSVLVDIALPYLVADFLRDVSHGAESLTMPWLIVVVCGCIVLVAPVRSYTVRRLEYLVRSRLARRIQDVTSSRVTAFSRVPGEMGAAVKTFLEAWTQFVLALMVYGPPLVVTTIGMAVLMGFRAPFMIVVILATAVLTTVITRTAGSRLLRVWHVRIERGQKEFEVFDNLFASHSVHWLLQLVGIDRLHAGQSWLKASRVHGMAVFWWHAATNSLTSALYVAAIGGSVFLANGHEMETGTVFLLVWFSGVLSERVQNLFTIAEAVGSRLAEARLLVEELMTGEMRPQAPSSKVSSLRFRGVVVTFQETTADGVATEKVIRLPDQDFRSGITLLTGDNGKGKSTLLRVAIGMQPYVGSVVLTTPDGDVKPCEFDVRWASVYVAQSIAPPGSGAVSALFGGASDIEIAQACRWGAFPVSGVPLDRPLIHLSGGERRLAYNSAALHAARHTRLLLWDEPTNDLSRSRVAEMIKGLEDYAAQHPETIILVVSHEPELLKRGYNTVYM